MKKKEKPEDILVKTFKYKIQCRQKSITETRNALNICRELYNSALLQKEIWYKSVREPRNISCFEQKKEITLIRESWPEMNNYPSCIYQEAIIRLDKTFNNFFRNLKKGIKKGYPQYKNRIEYNTLIFSYNGGWYIGRNSKGNRNSSLELHNGLYDQKIEHNILWVNGIGRLKMLEYHKNPIIGKPVQLSLTLEGDVLWANITVEYKKNSDIKITKKFVGLDVGINYLISDSDRKQWDPLKNKQEDPLYKYYNEYKEKRLKLQRKKSILEKNNQKVSDKTILKIREIDNTLSNMKRHYYYNIASYYVKNYDIIVMENLLIRNMSKSVSGTIENPGKNVAQKRGLNRSILEQSWYLLRMIIENKCKEHSRQFILVDPKYTSQQCSECGNIFYKSLSQRTHFCKICGFQEDRDINAAHNILRKGLESLQKQAA